jgi:hypothetical protein
MTEDRKKLIAKFQKWLDTNPRKELIASQCANIAEEYHDEQLKLCTFVKSVKEKEKLIIPKTTSSQRIKIF